MKRFLKLNVLALVALLFLGVADAWGLGIKKNVDLNQLTAEGDKGSWNSNTKEMRWTDSSYNLFYLADWSNSDLSQYDQMVINTSDARGNYRVVITVGKTNYTIGLSGDGDKVIALKNNKNLPANLSNVKSIRIGGNSRNGSVKINSIYFHKTVNWDSNGKITFYAQDFNVGANVTKNVERFTFTRQYASITLDFDNDGLSTTEIGSFEMKVTTTRGSIYPVFEENSNKWATDLTNAQNKGVKLGVFRICANSNDTRITFGSNDKITFTKAQAQEPEQPVIPVFDVTEDRVFFEDFENLDNNPYRNKNKGIVSVVSQEEQDMYLSNPEGTHSDWQGRYLNYGGRGQILKDPTFGHYYQNLADADEYTKSIAENYLRMILTDTQKSNLSSKIKSTGAVTVGFWVNGQVAVDYELPLERGSMFCIFSNLRFRKADAGKIEKGNEPRFMFDISCNGWNYSYMPNNDSGPTIVNQYAYAEQNLNSGVSNPLASLFGKNNYAHTLDQSKHKFYDDKKWHYITYVMDKGNNNIALSHVTMYVDGVKTGEIANVRNTNGYGLYDVKFEDGGDYVGRTGYLRNIVLGGFTPHGMFYDRQYYSDAALAYDDIAIYGKALTKEQIQSIINQKQYTTSEWHYSDFDEYNAGKGGNETENNVSGLGLYNPTFDNKGDLIVKAGTQITIPNVPKNYYVRIEYDTADGTESSDDNFVYVGRRDGEKYYTDTYQALKAGTYKLDILDDVKIRSIVITPYQYAVLKYGNWNSEHTYCEPLQKKYITFTIHPRYGVDYFYEVAGSNNNYYVVDEGSTDPKLPEVSLNIDGKWTEDGADTYYEDVKNGYKEGKDNPYIKYKSTAPHVAYIDKDGKITLTGIAGNTTIIAEVISDNLFNGSEVADSFEIRIRKEDNTFRLAHNDEVEVNEKYPSATSNKNLKNITMTIGGWHHTDTYNLPGKGQVSDSWGNAETWVGKVNGSQEILDDFNQFSLGNYVAKSESLGNDDGDFHPEIAFANNVTPWTLPCRGAYVKFEPVKPGIVTMYLLQEGNLDDVIVDEKGNKRSSHVYWRPVYITDETGKIIDFVQTATNGYITKNDNFFVGDKRRAQFIESIAETYNMNSTLRQDLLNLRDNDYNKFRTLIDNWANAGWKEKVIPTGDGGYMVMSKAMVRYTFNVHPGKTYYLFSNQKQIAISGFNFEEGRLLDTETQDYETAPIRKAEEGEALNFTDVLGDKQPEIPTGGDDITPVTYQRNFAQGKWSSICLPFSMNNRQLREQFGENTSVVLLKGIHDDGKIELIWHVNQDIIAGYPYFILPRGELKNKNVTNSTITKISVDAYFNSAINKEKPLISIGSNGETFNWQGSYNGECYKADYPYVFEGNFTKEDLPAGSYVMSNDGALTKTKKNVTAKPFRAYLKYQGSDAANAKPLYTTVNWQNDDETTTSIDDIMFQNGILTESTDVYSIDGTVIRHDVQNLSDLSKGVYIVNGKKFVVK